MASRSGASVSLTWTGGVTPFDVYRSNVPGTLYDGVSQITETASPSWLDTPPAATLTCYGVKTAPDSVRIATARSQPDGPVSIPIVGSIVTYTRPAIGNDSVGFFIQDVQQGPALFVGIDPATLSPSPAVGDRVGFTITSMGTIGGLREIVTLSNYVRTSTGNPTAGLVQDLSAVDITTNIGSYESELMSITGTLAGPLVSQGTGFVGAQLSTAGNPLDQNLLFRTPISVADTQDLEQSCVVRVTSTPLWRFNAVAEPTALSPSEVSVLSCPAPRVTQTHAVSSTSVEVDFDRRIDPASVHPSGDQFVFSGGLTASAATVSTRSVTVTTSAQTPTAPYDVTVAATVTDLLGSSVDAGANSASFTGYAPPVILSINEVNPNITGQKDLLEILVVVGGSTAGITLEQSVAAPTVLATLPDIPVASGDIIVVHLNPGVGEGPGSETTSKTQYPANIYPNNYDTAWDVNGGTTGITNNDRVLVLRRPTGVIIDAVPFIVPAGAPVTAFPTDLQAIQAAGQWLPSDCGGVACTYSTVPSAEDISVSWAGVGTTPGGFSVQRKPIGDTNTQSDWKAASASSFGSPNSP